MRYTARRSPGARSAPRHRIALDRGESLRLPASVPFGRISAVDRALPITRPVNHLVENGCVILRTYRSSTLTVLTANARSRGAVLAYEADEIDPATRTGWSVIVTGRMGLIDGPHGAALYRLLLHPWVDDVMDRFPRIRADAVTGVRLTLVASPPDADPGGLIRGQ